MEVRPNRTMKRPRQRMTFPSDLAPLSLRPAGQPPALWGKVHEQGGEAGKEKP